MYDLYILNTTKMGIYYDNKIFGIKIAKMKEEQNGLIYRNDILVHDIDETTTEEEQIAARQSAYAKYLELNDDTYYYYIYVEMAISLETDPDVPSKTWIETTKETVEKYFSTGNRIATM